MSSRLLFGSPHSWARCQCTPPSHLSFLWQSKQWIGRFWVECTMTQGWVLGTATPTASPGPASGAATGRGPYGCPWCGHPEDQGWKQWYPPFCLFIFFTPLILQEVRVVRVAAFTTLLCWTFVLLPILAAYIYTLSIVQVILPKFSPHMGELRSVLHHHFLVRLGR
jgi:hypothetical protein